MTRQARIATAAAALVAALGADVWFIHRPEPHSVGEFSPFKTNLGREELILSRPESEKGPLLSHQGGKNEVVDLFFDAGVLSDETRQLLRQQPWAQSEDPQTISYTTLDSPGAKGAPCRTFVNASLDHARAAGIRLFQNGVAGGEQHREIEVKPEDSHLVVDLQTVADDPTQPNQPGCRKLLQVGPGQIQLVGVPLKILAQPGSSFRLKFMPGSSAPIWKGRRGLFEPFQAINLRAQRARVSPVNSPQKLLMVDTADPRRSIYVDSLLIGSDFFEAGLSGVGMVTINGHLVGPTFSEWRAASSARSAIVALLNLLLLIGAVIFAMRRRRLNLDLTATPGATTGPPSHGLRVFLCHCSEDKAAVRQLNQQLEADAFQPWLDEQDIFPGRLWDDEIQQALHSSHAIVVCLSKVFVHKEGFVQRELRYALDIASEKLDGAVFLIPVRLENCEIPARLSALQCIDLFTPPGYEKLKSALHERARQVGIETTTFQAAGA